MTALYVILIIVAVIMLILLIPVDCIVDISINDDGNKSSITVKYGFIKIKLLPNEKKVKPEKEPKKETGEAEEVQKEKNDIGAILTLLKTIYNELSERIFGFIDHFFRHTLRIKELNISAVFGLGDPMYTGIVTGGAYSVVYAVLSGIDNHTRLDKWHVSLEPDFENKCLSAGVYCKIRTRILYVLKLGMMAAVLLLKIIRINRRLKKNG